MKKVTSLLDFNYPSAINILNRNIFIVEKDGIFVYDEHLENIIHNYPFFSESDKIDTLDKLSKVIIKSKRNYVICLINSKIYFFDYEGKLLVETEKLITDANIYNPTLTPIIFNEDNYYYYAIAYFINSSGSYKLKILYYKINITTKSNHYIDQLTIDKREVSYVFFTDTYYFQNQGLSCEYMEAENNQEDNFLVCFFIFKLDDKLYLSQSFFGITTNSLANKDNDKYDPTYVEDISTVNQI